MTQPAVADPRAVASSRPLSGWVLALSIAGTLVLPACSSQEGPKPLAAAEVFVPVEGFRFASVTPRAEREVRERFERSKTVAALVTDTETRVAFEVGGDAKVVVLSTAFEPIALEHPDFHRQFLAGLAEAATTLVEEKEIYGLPAWETLGEDGVIVLAMKYENLIVWLYGRDQNAVEDLADALARASLVDTA